jgi:hypothetical protein
MSGLQLGMSSLQSVMAVGQAFDGLPRILPGRLQPTLGFLQASAFLLRERPGALGLAVPLTSFGEVLCVLLESSRGMFDLDSLAVRQALRLLGSSAETGVIAP